LSANVERSYCYHCILAKVVRLLVSSRSRRSATVNGIILFSEASASFPSSQPFLDSTIVPASAVNNSRRYTPLSTNIFLVNVAVRLVPCSFSTACHSTRSCLLDVPVATLYMASPRVMPKSSGYCHGVSQATTTIRRHEEAVRPISYCMHRKEQVAPKNLFPSHPRWRITVHAIFSRHADCE